MAAVLPFPQSAIFRSSFVLNLLRRRLPRKYKRILFVMSVMGVFHQTLERNAEVAKRISEAVNAHDEKQMLDNCGSFSELVWRGIGKRLMTISYMLVSLEDFYLAEPNEEELTRLGTYFVRNAPDYLVYGSHDLMVHDAVTVLREIQAEFNERVAHV